MNPKRLNPFTPVKWKFIWRYDMEKVEVRESLNPFTQVKWKFRETVHPVLQGAALGLNPFTQVKWKFYPDRRAKYEEET